jgi:hypothetical protein
VSVFPHILGMKLGLLSLVFFSILSSAEQPQARIKTKVFESAEQCSLCHMDQHSEWKGSMMHYGARSPVFQAFELTVRKISGRFGPDDNENPTFCINCHSPMTAYNNELAGVPRHGATLGAMGTVGMEGVSCTFCHSYQGARPEPNHKKGIFGDGVANASVIFFPVYDLVGPSAGGNNPPLHQNGYHGFEKSKNLSKELTSSKFCGSCHDVRIPGLDTIADEETKEPFQRLENLYTEWAQGPYNSAKNPYGKPVSCQDCHMSLYGSLDPKTGKSFLPGTYPNTIIGLGSQTQRKHSLHRFTAVSFSLLNDPETFPNQDNPTKDRFGAPIGQQQKRNEILKAACTLNWGEMPKELSGKLDVLPVKILITNTGAGHRVPAGFSQEREVWLELNVRTDSGLPIYRSGFLVDKSHNDVGEQKPDGNLEDEDLEDVHYTIDPETFEVKRSEAGPDLNLRPFANYGLATFTNAFMRRKGAGFERVMALFLPSFMDNSRSLPMLEPVPVKYDVPLQNFLVKNPNFSGQFFVTAKLRFRSFPPKILRVLAEREPQFVDESLIDRNTIVDMAVLETSIPAKTIRAAETSQLPPEVTKASYSFTRGNTRWLSFFRPAPWTVAREKCQASGCELATENDYNSLNLQAYKPVPGDNKDELLKERWTRDLAEEIDGRAAAHTHLFLSQAKETAVADKTSLTSKHFMCVCKPEGK